MKTMNLWVNYKKVLHDTFDLQFAHPWADWESKGTVLSAKVFKKEEFIDNVSKIASKIANKLI